MQHWASVNSARVSPALDRLYATLPVVPVGAAVLERAIALSAGLNARVSLVAVHAVPYPLDFGCPASTHAFLVERLNRTS